MGEFCIINLVTIMGSLQLYFRILVLWVTLGAGILLDPTRGGFNIPRGTSEGAGGMEQSRTSGLRYGSIMA